MSNVVTLYGAEAAAQYQREGAQRVVDFLKMYANFFEFAGDGISRSVTSALSTTVTAVKASAGNMYAVIVDSPAAATEDAFIQVFNVASGTVNLGTTAPGGGVIVAPAGKLTARLFVPGNDSNDLFDTAISIAATTTHDGNTALGSASRPTVTVFYA